MATRQHPATDGNQWQPDFSRRLLHLEVHQGELRAFQADGQQMDLSLD